MQPSDPGFKLERQRALARARQQRKRDRERRVVVMRDDNGMPSRRHAMVAQALQAGASVNAALKGAGFPHSSTNIVDNVRKQLADECRKRGLHIGKVIDSAVERLDATSPLLTASGSIDKPDWSARASGARDGLALLDRAGELPASTSTAAGTSITVNIVRFEAPQPVVDPCETAPLDVQFTRREELTPQDREA